MSEPFDERDPNKYHPNKDKALTDQTDVPNIAESQEVDYIKRLTDRYYLDKFGKTFQEYREEKAEEFLVALRAGKISTANLYHEADMRKIEARFCLVEPDDFVRVKAPASLFKKFYPSHEGGSDVVAFRLNPEKFGPPPVVIPAEDPKTLFD